MSAKVADPQQIIAIIGRKQNKRKRFALIKPK